MAHFETFVRERVPSISTSAAPRQSLTVDLDVQLWSHRRAPIAYAGELLRRESVQTAIHRTW